jgi:hypothetical protein
VSRKDPSWSARPGGAGHPAAGPPPRSREGAERSRGQTTLDFAIGVSLFLSVMLFVFAFVPGILQPFNLSGEENIVRSERIASDLSQGTLGDASTPYVLESNCAIQFFDDGSSPPGHCNYDGDDLHERLAVSNVHNLNVTLSGALDGGLENELVCWDATDEVLVEASDGACGDDGADEVLAIGSVPPEANDATVTSRRVVSLHQKNLTMQVVAW